jgi:hypothetical protein
MPLDRRLRDGVDRLTSQVDPDVDRSLDRTFRRARRTIALRRVGAASVVAASIALAIVVGPRAIDALRSEPGPRPAATPTLKDVAFVAGTYETVVPNDEPAVRQNGLAGRWTIRFGTDGVMTVTAPDSFTGVTSGTLFEIQGDRLRTNLFVQDVCSNIPTNSYRWTEQGTKLTFIAVEDPCQGRVAVLTSSSWSRVG